MKTMNISKEKRFIITYQQETNDDLFQVIKDSETGKSYFYYQYGRSGALTEIK